ncbi:DUF2306 domain-containing protein [Actinoalloteichus hymeniacidonis]|uniref:Membrane protein n=1 Tax=Actinoalloteichus hymeniacidonis TaxID=340345 RepID=A0AAC9HTU2_9PSEU|nr:DUF2306 domain-containing protein [Actinoalloteichus hymeniacidonis]AOS65290.1 putative membrane protein [Actinoalloteichus hymeniacidonis]MBB5906626.1 putative membrane protein [Actinoalloteichus hymeniacidonis]
MNAVPKTIRRRTWWVLWSLLAATAIATSGLAVPPYLTGDPTDSTMSLNPDVAAHYLSIIVHAVPGGLALIIGPFQFVGGLRARYPKLHRIAGRVYLVCVVWAALASLVAAVFSISGLAAQMAFVILAAAWTYTGVQAYRAIRRGEVALHRTWMIRNYALTFAAVTLRVYLGVGLLLQGAFPSLTFSEVYTASAWTSFVLNALVAEYFIVQRTLRPRARHGRADAEDSGPTAVAVVGATAGQRA